MALLFCLLIGLAILLTAFAIRRIGMAHVRRQEAFHRMRRYYSSAEYRWDQYLHYLASDDGMREGE